MNRFFISIALTLVTFACKESNSSTNKFSDDTLIKIADLKDRRSSDSLRRFMTDKSEVYRLEAALAFGSVQDTLAVASLSALLKDESAQVRKATAFALGQTRCQESAQVITQALTAEEDAEVVNELFEAYGKVTKSWKPIESKIEKSAYEQGLSWSLYRAGLRGKVDSIHNLVAIQFLTEGKTESTRLAAAHFFARGAKNFTRLTNQISQVALTDSSVDVRMAATLSLRKIKTDSSFIALENILNTSKDYRIKVNAIRAMQVFPYARTKNQLQKLVSDPKQNVAVAASEAILASALKEDWIPLANLAPEVTNWRVQANLYKTILKLNENPGVTAEIKNAYKNSINSYQKAALLTALQESITSIDFIEQQLFENEVPIIKTTAANALTGLNYHKQFTSKHAQRFAELYKKAMATKDPAVIGAIAQTLSDSTLNYRSIIKDYKFLYDAKAQLSLPKDNEALQPLEAAIAYFEGRKLPVVKNEYNHPMDWNLIKTIPKKQKASIQTSRGTILIQFFVEESPGSVANFVALARQNYFDKKYFHRIVPNFVIQGGCNRGDGTGSEDYSIRSEFGQRKYTTGSLGMASAGKDTEGTQWFITHSPTPHLDGGYTIFAEVLEGMEAVHLMEIGDQILKIEILAE